MKKRFSPDEVARLLGITLTTVYREMQRGKLPHLRVGRKYIILRPDLAAYLGGEERLEYLLDESEVLTEGLVVP